MSPEETLARELIVAIARGTYRSGDLLPPETELAHQRVLAPSKVVWAYRRLAELGLVLDYGEQRTMVVEDAEMRARARLLEDFAASVAREVDVLRAAGCAPEEISRAIATVVPTG